jgi:hypothetical protein
MANITRLIGGSLASTWTSAGFTATDFNNLANGSGVLSTTPLNNTNGDLTGEVSFSMLSSIAIAPNSRLDLYLLALNQDGTTYGDGTPTGSTVPSWNYWVATAGMRAVGSTATGRLPIGQDLPNGNFKLWLQVTLGSALAGSAAASVQIRTTNINLNG